jgi:hypothetical protein
VAGLGQHPPAEGADDPAALGEVQEAGRRQQAQLRVLPAHEGLVADDRGVAEREDRLVEGPQLVRLERHPQVVLQLQVRPVEMRSCDGSKAT